ncbi:PfkB family carbohydrate kinase [Fibrobacterota bacterium]
MHPKIVDLENLASLCASLKNQGKTVVHCHGCFDLVHPGHIKHFEAAKRKGNILLVTITEDKFVDKGPGRPVFGEELRAETIAALESVDYVAINRAPTAIPVIEQIKPDYYVKGQEYKDFRNDVTGQIVNEKAAVEKSGGKMIFTEEMQFSSSRLINKYLAFEDKGVNEYLQGIKGKFSFCDIERRFAEIQNYEVLIVGDIILDEYQFVQPLGKSSKSANITARILDRELYAGGVLAVANHIANFAGKVTLVSTYGENSGINYHDFIRRHLHPKIEFSCIHVKDRPTTVKRRFIDNSFKGKIFEVIEINDAPLGAEENNRLLAMLGKTLNRKIDVAVAADFGHGILDLSVIDYLCDNPCFLAISAQTNSANIGYNLLTKYSRCDYFCIDKDEARLAVHDKISDIQTIHSRLMKSTGADTGCVTLGIEGSMVGSKESPVLTHAPVLSHEVLDTIGAGDAFFAVTSLLVKAGASIEEVAFIGNAVGAMAVKILGNKASIQKTSLLKYVKTLLA